MTKTKLAFLIGAMTILFACIAGCSGGNNIKFNGYYSNQQHHNGVPMFFRFYKDGVVTASLPSVVNGAIMFTPDQLDNSNPKTCTIRGRYVLNGNSVSFRLVDPNGTADFSGEFGDHAVTLKAHSNINGRDSVTTFEFYKW
jgi:hypothetical protein